MLRSHRSATSGRPPHRTNPFVSRFLSGLILLLLLAALGRGQAPAEKEQPTVEKWQTDRALTISPAAAPLPALKYRLFPSVMDRKEGNAVPIYLRLVYEQGNGYTARMSEGVEKWKALPLSKPPVAEARDFISGYSHTLRQMELGARRKNAEWNYTLDQGPDFGGVYGIRVGDAQTMRAFGRLLAVAARVQAAEGDFPAAIHTLETGLAFSQQVSDGGLLMNSLIGMAIATPFLDTATDLMERPGAPNLYWALTALPRPFIDFRKSLELEQRTMELQFPELTDLGRPRGAAECDALLLRVRRLFGQPAENPPNGPAVPADDEPAEKSKDLPAARKYLIEHSHLPKADLEAMPPSQILLLAIYENYKTSRAEVDKLVYLPWREAQPMYKQLKRELASRPIFAGVSTQDLLAYPERVALSSLRLERKIAALRVIEALRMHAAAHDGKLPEKLSDVTVVPVPDDPATGKPFEYSKDDATATLLSRIPGEPLETTGLRYRITVKK